MSRTAVALALAGVILRGEQSLLNASTSVRRQRGYW
jgi:hypothetical protein